MVASVGVAVGPGVEEGPPLLEEVVELALLVAGAGRLVGEGACLAADPEEDVGYPVEGELFALWQFGLLLVDLLAAWWHPYRISSQMTSSKVFSPFSCWAAFSLCLRICLLWIS